MRQPHKRWEIVFFFFFFFFFFFSADMWSQGEGHGLAGATNKTHCEKQFPSIMPLIFPTVLALWITICKKKNKQKKKTGLC